MKNGKNSGDWTIAPCLKNKKPIAKNLVDEILAIWSFTKTRNFALVRFKQVVKPARNGGLHNYSATGT